MLQGRPLDDYDFSYSNMQLHYQSMTSFCCDEFKVFAKGTSSNSPDNGDSPGFSSNQQPQHTGNQWNSHVTIIKMTIKLLENRINLIQVRCTYFDQHSKANNMFSNETSKNDDVSYTNVIRRHPTETSVSRVELTRDLSSKCQVNGGVASARPTNLQHCCKHQKKDGVKIKIGRFKCLFCEHRFANHFQSPLFLVGKHAAILRDLGSVRDKDPLLDEPKQYGEKSRNRSTFVRFPEGFYSCTFCEDWLEGRNRLANHIRIMHFEERLGSGMGKNDPMEIPQEVEDSPNAQPFFTNDLEEEACASSSRKLYPCPYCNEQIQESRLAEHLRVHHAAMLLESDVDQNHTTEIPNGIEGVSNAHFLHANIEVYESGASSAGKLYPCPYCDEHIQEARLADHLKVQHADMLLESDVDKNHLMEIPHEIHDLSKVRPVHVNILTKESGDSSAGKLYPCPYCNERIQEARLAKHLRVKHAEMLMDVDKNHLTEIPCQIEGILTGPLHANIVAEESSASSTSKLYPCAYCDEHIQEARLADHLKVQHAAMLLESDGDNNHLMEIPNEIEGVSNAASFHANILAEEYGSSSAGKLYPCPYCNEEIQEARLAEHLRIKHADMLLESDVSENNPLEIHRVSSSCLKHQPLLSDIDTDESDTSSTDLNVNCPYCDESFCSHRSFANHLRNKHVERLFEPENLLIVTSLGDTNGISEPDNQQLDAHSHTPPRNAAEPNESISSHHVMKYASNVCPSYQIELETSNLDLQSSTSLFTPSHVDNQNSQRRQMPETQEAGRSSCMLISSTYQGVIAPAGVNLPAVSKVTSQSGSDIRGTSHSVAEVLRRSFTEVQTVTEICTETVTEICAHTGTPISSQTVTTIYSETVTKTYSQSVAEEDARFEAHPQPAVADCCHCPYCNTLFHSMGVFQNHLQTEHGNTLQADTDRDNTSMTKSKCFENSIPDRSLTEGIALHEENTSKCPACGQMFTDLHTFIEHLRIKHPEGLASVQLSKFCVPEDDQSCSGSSDRAYNLDQRSHTDLSLMSVPSTSMCPDLIDREKTRPENQETNPPVTPTMIIDSSEEKNPTSLHECIWPENREKNPPSSGFMKPKPNDAANGQPPVPDDLYRCLPCQKIYRCPRVYLCHCEQEHSERIPAAAASRLNRKLLKPFRCPSCDTNFEGFSGDDERLCRECGHLQLEHLGQLFSLEVFTCAECLNGFRLKPDLAKHLAGGCRLATTP